MTVVKKVHAVLTIFTIIFYRCIKKLINVLLYELAI